MKGITRIHVNRHKIDGNRKHGTNDAVLTVKRGKRNDYGVEVQVLGPCTIVYRPDKPLPCGARVWIETTSDVVIKPAAEE